MMKIAIALVCLVVLGPAFAQDGGDLEVYVNTVKNRSHASAGGARASQIASPAVETTSLTRVESDDKGVVRGQTTFFFPMAPDKLADYLMTPEGAGKVTVFGHSAVPKAPTSDGKGWTGEVAVDLDQMQSSNIVQRTMLSPEAREMVKASTVRQLKAPFTATRENAGDVATVRYSLSDAKLVDQADITLRIQANGGSASLVTVNSRTRTALKDEGERLLLAKQMLRSIPTVLDQALSNQGR